MTHTSLSTPNKSLIWGAVIIVVVGFMIFLPSAANIRWQSDDYILVRGIYSEPASSWADYLSTGHVTGVLTGHRLLHYWLIGYVGNLLRLPWVHFLAIAVHCGVAVVAMFLWLRLGFGRMAAFSAAFFEVITLWSTEPVIWWTAIYTSVTTLFLLLGVHAFISAQDRRQKGKPVLFFTVAAMILTFLALCFYDIWAFGWLFYLAVAYRLEVLNTEGPSLIGVRQFASRNHLDLWKRSVRRALPMVVPFMVWGMWVALAGLTLHNQSRIALTWLRVPLVLASMHARVINWFVGPDWHALFKIGLDHRIAQTGIVVAGVTICWLIGCRKAVKTAATMTVEKTTLTQDLLFIWLIFLAGRLALLPLGGISTGVDRINYGSLLILSLGLFVVLLRLLHRKKGWRDMYLPIALSPVIMFMTAGSIAKANHRALSTNAEEETPKLLAAHFLNPDDHRTVVIVGTPVGDLKNTTADYFVEGNGLWLGFLLKAKGYSNSAYVVRNDEITVDKESIHLDLNDGEKISLLRSNVMLLQWKDGQIANDQPAAAQ